jgi:extracellular elastinolytic metalloproteinase
MLLEMYWVLVDRAGFSSNWMNASQTSGNIIAMQLLFGGVMLQPCNPTFIQGRDAILKADRIYYSGRQKCDIWRAFAKRGLGEDASGSKWVHQVRNGFRVPSECAFGHENMA